VLPKDFESLIAISGDSEVFPLIIFDRIERVTPSASAAFVIVRPSGSMHNSLIISPGWGGSFMGMVYFLVVVN
jgi:hypothetical protein